MPTKRLDFCKTILASFRVISATYLAFLVSTSSAISSSSREPVSFGEPLQNLTVAVGREAVFSCVIHNIRDHQVAWFHKEKHTLLALQDKVITRNHRIRVTNQGPSTFSLHVTDVRQEDAGTYSCQINSSPMKSQSGHLEVVVPARFVEHLTSSDLVTPEDSSVSLRCVANGFPMPEIKWRREDGQVINIRSGAERVPSIAGEYLNLTSVQDEDSGAYICIASNGIPPAPSKRIFLGVTLSEKTKEKKRQRMLALEKAKKKEVLRQASHHHEQNNNNNQDYSYRNQSSDSRSSFDLMAKGSSKTSFNDPVTTPVSTRIRHRASKQPNDKFTSDHASNLHFSCDSLLLLSLILGINFTLV